MGGKVELPDEQRLSEPSNVMKTKPRRGYSFKYGKQRPCRKGGNTRKEAGRATGMDPGKHLPWLNKTDSLGRGPEVGVCLAHPRSQEAIVARVDLAKGKL